MGNVYCLRPNPPKKDMEKMFKNDMHILRFKAQIVSNKHDDMERHFILSFFCGDDEIQVFEVALRNSGRVGGKFLDKRKHKNPINGNYYNEKDMKVGALLLLSGFKFRLM